MIQEGSAAPYALTGSGVSVTKLIFTTEDTGTSTKLVGIDMTLAALLGTTTRTTPFKASATLRNSY